LLEEVLDGEKKEDLEPLQEIGETHYYEDRIIVVVPQLPDPLNECLFLCGLTLSGLIRLLIL